MSRLAKQSRVQKRELITWRDVLERHEALQLGHSRACSYKTLLGENGTVRLYIMNIQRERTVRGKLWWKKDVLTSASGTCKETKLPVLSNLDVAQSRRAYIREVVRVNSRRGLGGVSHLPLMIDFVWRVMTGNECLVWLWYASRQIALNKCNQTLTGTL